MKNIKEVALLKTWVFFVMASVLYNCKKKKKSEESDT